MSHILKWPRFLSPVYALSTIRHVKKTCEVQQYRSIVALLYCSTHLGYRRCTFWNPYWWWFWCSSSWQRQRGTHRRWRTTPAGTWARWTNFYWCRSAPSKRLWGRRKQISTRDFISMRPFSNCQRKCNRKCHCHGQWMKDRMTSRPQSQSILAKLFSFKEHNGTFLLSLNVKESNLAIVLVP